MTINWGDGYRGAKLLVSRDGPKEFVRQIQTKQFWQDFSNTVISGSEAIAAIGVAIAQPELGIGETLGMTEEVAGASNALKETAKITGAVGGIVDKSIKLQAGGQRAVGDRVHGSSDAQESVKSASGVVGAFESLAGSQLSGFDRIGQSAGQVLRPLKKLDRVLGVVGVSSGLFRNVLKNPLVGLPEMTAVQLGLGVAHEALETEGRYLEHLHEKHLERGVYVPPHPDDQPLPNSGYAFTQLNYPRQRQVISSHSGGQISAVS